MKIVWSVLARDDLVAIRRYIAQHHPAAARQAAERILHSVELLRERPQLGLSTHRGDIRRLIVGNSVYSIIYRLRDDALEILEIFDGRQDAPRIDLDGDL